MTRAVSGVLALAVLFAITAVAHAGYLPLLNNVTTGQAILDDNFESYSLSSVPYNCGPAAATWGSPTGVGDGTGNAVGVWPNNYGGLTPVEGTKCLLLDRGPESVGCSITGYGDAGRSAARETVKAQMLFYNFNLETSVYLKQDNTNLFEIGLYGGADTAAGHVKVVDPTGQSWIDTGATFPGDAAPAWTKLEVTHVNGTNQFSISVNGGTAYVATGFAAGNVNAITFQCDGPHSTGVFDAVPTPEPASVTLLAVGLAGLVAYAWRRRK